MPRASAQDPSQDTKPKTAPFLRLSKNLQIFYGLLDTRYQLKLNLSLLAFLYFLTRCCHLSSLISSFPFILFLKPDLFSVPAMQRALSSAARSSLSSSSPYSRSAGKSLQQLRFAHKELRFGVEGRAQLLKGVETLSKAVATTLGPKGRNVLIESSYGSPKITKGKQRESS